MRPKSDLRKYQLDLIQKIKEQDRILLAVDMGLGKTVSCLTAMEELDDVKKVLIIAPKMVATEGWPDEIKGWEHLKGCTYTILSGTPAKREKLLERDTKYYLLGRDSIGWLFKTSTIKWDAIIWDESSSLKNPKKYTGKGRIKGQPLENLSRFGTLLHLSEHVKRVILLTGTPSPNGLQDIYGQVSVLDRGAALGGSFNKFCEEYFIDRSRSHLYKKLEARHDSYDKVMAKISHIVIKMKSDDYIELPDFIPINVFRDMDLASSEIYKKLKKHFILKEDGVKAKIIANNETLLVNKLLQLATGSVYREDGTFRTFHTLKIDMLKEIIEENPGENFLVFYHYQHEREQLEKAFAGEIKFFTDKPSKGDETIKKQWNEGKIKILACHPASAGHGHNLQYGGSTMVWMSLLWSLELYQQACKRLHRSGQTKPVRCYHLLTKDTYEAEVLKVLQKKDITQEKVYALIKEIKGD